MEEFIHIDKLLAEISASQSWDDHKELTQRDFEFLIESIYIKTQTRISLSTIKRIWYHESKYLPRVSTLDILCQYLNYSSWSQYKVALIDGKKPVPRLIQKSKKYHFGSRLFTMIFGGFALIFLILLFVLKPFSRDPENYAKASFEINNMVGNAVPVTVVFSYDVSEVEFDSAFIQLSWNRLERHPLTRDENLITSLYYIPGLHHAKLIINDSIVQTRDVFVEHHEWLTIYRSEPEDIIPIYIDSDRVYKSGFIQADPGLLAEFRADTSRASYYVSYIRSKEFDIEADNFSFITRIKNPTSRGKFYCQSSSIYIYAEKGGIYLTFNQAGCSGNTSVVIGDRVVSGRRNDLSKLSRDFSKWQEIKGVVQNKNFQIFVNDTLAYETEYKQDMGKIMTWQYFFMGHGAVDHLIMQNENGDAVFQDFFEPTLN